MTIDPWSVLTAHQAATSRTFLAAREAERKHLVTYLSGAHAYGFPSPDSDLDLKAIHIAPTRTHVGLAPTDEPNERIDIVDGVELDYGSNELGGVLRSILKGNGNYLERIFGDLTLVADTALLADARTVIRPTLSRRVAHHYRGFAQSQLRAFDEKPTAKRALYVLRTAATGRHLLTTGELVTDLTRLPSLAPAALPELLAVKRRAEKEQLSPDEVAAWRPHLAATIAAIDGAYVASVLPPEPPADSIAALDAWLVEVRRVHW